jgi:hypothetical protein
MKPINFDAEKKTRDDAIKARLFEIRDAEKEYRRQHATYTANLDSLIDFVKTAKMPVVAKQGELTDQQLEDGLNERRAMAIINKAKKSKGDNWQSDAEVIKSGLQNFIRDTLWVNVRDTLYGSGFNADSLKYVPYAGGATFQTAILNDTLENGTPRNFFEVKVPYAVYLAGLDKQSIINEIDKANKLNKYAGLMIGSLDQPIDAGNWE